VKLGLWTQLSSEAHELLKRGLSVLAELLLSDHVSDFDSLQDRRRRAEGFEAHHRAHDLFDEPMILLSDVVEIFDLDDVKETPKTRQQEQEVDALKAS